MLRDSSPERETLSRLYFNNMKKIELTQGQYAIIDDQDYELVSSKKWFFQKVPQNSGYARATGGIFMHRFIMKTPAGMETDHINGNRLDNRRSNLRICTKQQNCWNRKVGIGRYRGVYHHKNRWVAQITKDGVRRIIGRFQTESEAKKAYDLMAKELYGEFAP